MWRPDGWANPYDNYFSYVSSERKEIEHLKNVFEIGADAMLEAIINKGIRVEDEVSCALSIRGIPGTLSWAKKGFIVFIPDDIDK